jgi:hypothetical protein
MNSVGAFRKTARTLAISLCAALAISTAVLAHNVGEMGSMDMPQGADAPQMGPGDVDAMSHGAMAMHDSHMAHGANMMLHMKWSDLRPANAADTARADKLVEELRTALAKYKDYHVAEAAGFKPFHPEFKTPVVHFTKRWYAIKAVFTFNPTEPTSLLYRHTPDGGYELIGAMYTAPRRWSEDQLNARVPLSVARWHQHINLCFPPRRTDMRTAEWTKFGPNGSIATEAACASAGGRWTPHLFGWMVHVYPWEKNPAQVWAH